MRNHPWSALLSCVLPITMLAGRSAQTTRPEFEVASVHENKSDAKPYSNFPMGPGPQFADINGHLSGRNLLFLQYILFAYKPANSYEIQTIRATLPEWVRSAHFDIEARAPGNPTKDEMRLMMQSLLESRFHIVVRREMREQPVFLLALAKAREAWAPTPAAPGGRPGLQQGADSPGDAGRLSCSVRRGCFGFARHFRRPGACRPQRFHSADRGRPHQRSEQRRPADRGRYRPYRAV